MMTDRMLRRDRRRGIALVPTMLVVSGLAIFTMALMTTVLSGQKTVVLQTDDYRVSSATESVAILAMESLWTGYLGSQAGAAGDIQSFRDYMTGLGIDHQDLTGLPDASSGTSLLSQVGIPGLALGDPEFNGVNIDAVNLVRNDDFGRDATRLYLTITASTSRGDGIVNPVMNRAVQQVWTVEPEDFDGFDFALLANNVNCIFCHTQVDSVERFYGTDGNNHGQFPRVKVGTLESLMVRKDMDGKDWIINDFDADSFIAGTLYSRGTATDHLGAPIADWSDLSLLSYLFDAQGNVLEDDWGDKTMAPFSPAGTPPGPMENLYLSYPAAFADMVDGNLPISFPAPIPDDGGVDPLTGLPDATGAANRVVDQMEFDTLAAKALGSITAGIVNVTPPGTTIDTLGPFVSAFTTGNETGIQQTVTGNVILTGTETNPITIDGTIAIDGDLIINGYVTGEGSLVVRGNVYVPTDLQYLDGTDANGNRTFGISPHSTKNALGLTAGGNILIGDYLRPSALQPDGSWDYSQSDQVIPGDSSGAWSFTLAEMSIFNRREWARTQEFLPAAGETDLPDPDPSTPRNEAWSVPNPDYDALYVPRYYGHGPGDEIPLFNRGNTYFDGTTGTWHGLEAAIAWDPAHLTYIDPGDPADPYLFDADGSPKAVAYTLTPSDGWLSDDLYKWATNYVESNRPRGPMRIDGLLYTNNAIFTLTSRVSVFRGQMILNGSLVAADLGMLVPGSVDPSSTNRSPLSNAAIGLQLNYDQRVKSLLNVKNPLQVQLKRTLWNPTANLL